MIRKMILSGALEPEKLYPVSYFAAQMGVSATPIREALLDLCAEGLLEARKNRGFRLQVLTDQDFDEIHALRLLLEPPSVASLAGGLSTAIAIQARDLCHATELCARAGDVSGFLEQDKRFHLTLLEQTGNKRLVEIVGKLRNEIRLGVPDAVRVKELEKSAREHFEVLEAIVERDAATVEALMRRHLSESRGRWTGGAEGRGPAATP